MKYSINDYIDNNKNIDLNWQSLDISDKFVNDLTGIERFESLKSLSIGSNIDTLRPLKNTNIKSLKVVDGKCLDSLFYIKHLDLVSLTVPYSNLKDDDLNIISGFKNLKYLDISSNYISDLSFINCLKKIEYLDISGTRIKNLSYIYNLKGLTVLNISKTLIDNLYPLIYLKNIRSLNISQTPVKDLNYLRNLKDLNTLVIGSGYSVVNEKSKINSLEPISTLKSLTMILANGTEIKDFSPISKMNISTLSLSSNDIDDSNINFLLEMENLSFLSLDNTDISNIQFISNLPNLTMFLCTDTKVPKEVIDMNIDEKKMYVKSNIRKEKINEIIILNL